MENYCAFSKNHTCLKWLDYVITRQGLEEADSLCHGNWIEIQRKNQYIQTLQEILDSNHISFPDEIQFNLIKGLATQPDPHKRPSRKTLKPDPGRRTLKNYAFFNARPYRQTLKQIGKP